MTQESENYLRTDPIELNRRIQDQLAREGEIGLTREELVDLRDMIGAMIVHNAPFTELLGSSAERRIAGFRDLQRRIDFKLSPEKFEDMDLL